MTNYEDDDLDDELANDEQVPVEGQGKARSTGNRNFFIALGVLGGIFVLVTIALVFVYLSRPKGSATANISATNAVIQTANAQTAVAATQTGAARALLLQPSDTPQATETPVPQKVTATSVLAQPTATSTSSTPDAGKGLASPTANAQTQTRSAPAVLTQSAQQTQTRQVEINLTATATALPKAGFADDVGLLGLFGMALGLVLIILLVRRLRFSTGS